MGIRNLMNGEAMDADTLYRRLEMKRRAGLPMGEWSGLDRAGRKLTVVWVSSRWRRMEMLDVYEIYV